VTRTCVPAGRVQPTLERIWASRSTTSWPDPFCIVPFIPGMACHCPGASPAGPSNPSKNTPSQPHPGAGSVSLVSPDASPAVAGWTGVTSGTRTASAAAARARVSGNITLPDV
jgi:hypothetical protein